MGIVVPNIDDIRFNNELQSIFEDMEAYVKQAQQYEQEVFYKYIEKGHTFYKTCIVLIYLITTIILLGPLVMPTSMPYDIEYPFPINNTVLYVTLYFHQSLLSYQCAAQFCLSGFGALILWYTTARFECLAIEIQKSSSFDTMVVCIKKQVLLMR